MDIGDLFLAFLPLDPPGSPSRDSSPREQVLGGIALLGFPVLCFVIVLFGGAWAHTMLAFLLPVALAATTVFLGRRLGVGTASTVRIALGSLLTCAFVTGCAFLLAIFTSFYSSF